MRVASIVLMILVMPFLMAFTQASPSKEKIDYSKVTQDSKLIQALEALDGTTGEPAKKAILGENLSKRPIKIMFKELSQLSPEYAGFDALGWKHPDGQLAILLSTKHMNAPIEALASILCHESIHQDTQSSIEEETFGWNYEASVWMQMKKKNPELKKPDLNVHPLVARLNTLEKMYKNANYTNKQIKNAVMSNPGYSGLPMFSPGYEK